MGRITGNGTHHEHSAETTAAQKLQQLKVINSNTTALDSPQSFSLGFCKTP